MRIALRERFVLAPGGRVHEDVAAFGLDPKLYLAVVDADFGVAGRVNGNHRVYPVADFRAENAALAQRITAGLGGLDLVDGEEDHPDWNPTFKVPLALCELRVDEDTAYPGKVAHARGRVAFLDTTHGRDMLTLYRAGLAIGFSSRGTGWMEEHLIDESSPYWDANEPFRNKFVGEVRGWKLETYDAVRVPSAGTFARPNKENHREATEAYARLVEAGMIANEEATTMTLAELKKNHAALVAELMAELRATVEGEGKMAEAQARCTALETELKTVREACNAEGGKVKALETELKTAQDAVTEATAKLAEADKRAKEANDKLAKAEHADAMAKAVIDAVEAAPAPHRKTVEAKLVKWVQDGKATTVEAVKAAGETLAEVAAEVAAATAAAATGLVRTEAADETPPAAPADGAAPPAELTVESAVISAAISKMRAGLGRE